MAWHWSGDKSLFESIVSYFIDAYMCQLACLLFKSPHLYWNTYTPTSHKILFIDGIETPTD